MLNIKWNTSLQLNNVMARENPCKPFFDPKLHCYDQGKNCKQVLLRGLGFVMAMLDHAHRARQMLFSYYRLFELYKARRHGCPTNKQNSSMPSV